MDEKALKKVIKQLVRESLTEIFAEMKLESIVEGVVSKKVSAPASKAAASNNASPKLSVREAILGSQEVERPSAPQTDAATRRKKIMESLGGDDMWKGIYADTASSDNPILEGDESPHDREEVPSSILESMGLMRDYSKHIGMEKKTVAEDDEWQKRREAHQKMMAEKIKRA